MKSYALAYNVIWEACCRSEIPIYWSTGVSGLAHTACVFYMCVFAHGSPLPSSTQALRTCAPASRNVILAFLAMSLHFLWEKCKDLATMQGFLLNHCIRNKSEQNMLRLCTRCSSNDLISKCKLSNHWFETQINVYWGGIHFNLLILLNYLKHS